MRFWVWKVHNFSDTASARALRRACIIAEDAAEFGIPIAKMGNYIAKISLNLFLMEIIFFQTIISKKPDYWQAIQ